MSFISIYVQLKWAHNATHSHRNQEYSTILWDLKQGYSAIQRHLEEAYSAF